MNFSRIEKFLGVIIVSFIIIENVTGIANPAAVYCEELGHTYKIIKTDQGEKGVCVFAEYGTKSEIGCDGWDFLKGKCGREYSYCAKQGYYIETVSDGGNSFSSEYAVCIPKVDSGGFVSTLSNKRIAVTDLFNLSEKIHSTSLKLDGTRKKPQIYIPYGIRTAESLPTVFNWRNKDGKNWLTPVKDQHSCGSCWAFSAVGIVESIYKIFGNNSELDLDLSEEHLVSDCSNAGSCCGGWHYKALDFIKDNGITDEECFPYADAACSCSGGACVAEAALYQSNTKNSDDILNLLRAFRDKGLKTKYVELYYEYSPTIKKILIENPDLLFEFAGLIVKYMPSMGYVIDDKNGKDLYVSRGDVQQVVSFVEKLKNEVEKRQEEIGRERSSELIESLEEFEEQFSAFEGKNFSQAFQDSVYITRDEVDIIGVKQTVTCNCKYSNIDIDNDINICSDVTCSDKCSNWNNKLWKIDNWGSVPNTIEYIKNYLIEKGPLSIAMGIGDDYGGYWDGDIYRCSDDSGLNHAVILVGYNDPGGYWIVRNSWGSSWEDGGYFKVGYGECSIGDYIYYAELLNATEGYCSASTNDGSMEWISKVKLNNEEKNSESSTYSDFTNDVLTTLQRGGTYTLYVKGHTISTWTEFVDAWIDFNNDKEFSDTEKIDLGSATFYGNYTFNKTFTVSNDATLSYTRMRVYLKWNSAPSPCENANYGEVEDYKIDIVEHSQNPTISAPGTGLVGSEVLITGISNTMDENYIFVYITDEFDIDVFNQSVIVNGGVWNLTWITRVDGDPSGPPLAPGTYTIHAIDIYGWAETTIELVTTSTTTTTSSTTTTILPYPVTVTRDLPASASANSSFTVTLTMDVDESNIPNAVGVTEYYPSGWIVSNISISGIHQGDRIEWMFWAMGNPVKDQTITYKAHVPASALGTATFSGNVDIGTVDPFDIVGDTELTIAALTGDLNGDGIVELSEVIDMINSWDQGQTSLADVIDAINNWAYG